MNKYRICGVEGVNPDTNHEWPKSLPAHRVADVMSVAIGVQLTSIPVIGGDYDYKLIRKELNKDNG